MSSENPCHGSGVHLRTLFLGDKRPSKEKVPGDLKGSFLREERQIQKTQEFSMSWAYKDTFAFWSWATPKKLRTCGLD